MGSTGWSVLSLGLGGVGMALYGIGLWPRRGPLFCAAAFFFTAQVIALIEAWQA